MPFALTQTDLEIIILSERSQKKTNFMISLTCGNVEPKKMIQMNLFTKQTQTQKINLWLGKGKCGGGRDKLGI